MLPRTALISMILAAGLAQAASAAPAAGPSDSDLKCMLVASAISQNPDPKARAIANPMVFYYLGRLDARTPGLALGPALQGEARKSQAAEMNVVAQKCVATVTARARALQALGGKPANPPPAAPASPPPATPAPN
jgi:hypothetical protein